MTVPPLVARAGEEALDAGPLLHALAAQRGRARVGAAGTAGAAWIASALPPGVPLFVAAARDPFPEDEDVHAVDDLEREAPYDLLVALERVEPEAALRLLAPGGTLVARGLAGPHPALAAVDVGPGLTLAVRAL